jgi:hypothetical protein
MTWLITLGFLVAVVAAFVFGLYLAQRGAKDEVVPPPLNGRAS